MAGEQSTPPGSGASSERRSLAGVPPVTAFELLGHECRLAIVRVLLAATRGGEDGLPFAALRDRVGFEDDGRFNYHLDRLRGVLVRRTGDGYRPAPAAVELERRFRPPACADDPSVTTPRCGTRDSRSTSMAGPRATADGSTGVD